MAPLERRPGDEDRDMHQRPPFQVGSHSRNASQDAEENRNVPHDSLHASVQLPVPVIPNLSRGQGQEDLDDEPEGEEPQVVEV